MKNIYTLILCFTALILSNVLGHILPPFSIFLSPIIIGGIASLILYNTNFPFLVKILFITSFIFLNDFAIRIYAGGTHDGEGNGWIVLFMFIGILIGLILVLNFGINNKKVKELLIGLLLAGSLIYLYISYFGTFGLVWTKPPCHEIKTSKSEKIFISDLKFSDSVIFCGADTFTVNNGWVEKEIKIDNSGIRKKNIETGKFNIIIKINGKFDKYGFYDKIYFKSHEDINDNRASQLRNEITFNVPLRNDSASLYFFKDHHLIKRIHAVPIIK